jgi:hypothetical protein
MNEVGGPSETNEADEREEVGRRRFAVRRERMQANSAPVLEPPPQCGAARADDIDLVPGRIEAADDVEHMAGDPRVERLGRDQETSRHAGILHSCR